MTVLVSGGTGFLGCHIIDLLVAEGHQVVLLTRAQSNLDRLSEILDKIDLADTSALSLDSIFKKYTIDQVIHLATYYGRDNDLSQVYNANVMYANRLLELSLSHGVKRFLNTDTFSSKDPKLEYLKAYHLSKRHFYEWGNLAAAESDMDFISMILQHPYGTKDSSSKFTSFIIDTLIQEKPSVELTAGRQRRDFIHASDVARAYLAVMTAPTLTFTDYEVGTGKSISIKGFIRLAKKMAKNETTELLFGALPTRSNEIMETKANIEALESLGWQPQMSLDAGLLELIDWQRENA